MAPTLEPRYRQQNDREGSMIALVIAAALLQSSAAQSEPVGEWTTVTPGRAGDARMLARRSHVSNQIWFRQEYPADSGGGPWRALRTLVELDCPGQRMRLLESTGYQNPGMQGVNVTMPLAGTWVESQPGTITEEMLTFGCPGG